MTSVDRAAIEELTAEEFAAHVPSQSDAEVVTSLQGELGSALFDFARHMGLTDDQAADAVQEALLRLWREMRNGKFIERPPAWLYRTVYHQAMAQHRLRRRLSLLLPRLAPRRTDYAAPDASDRITVWTAVDGLPTRQRQVLYLHYAADLPFEEVATVLGISASAARTHASRGVARLRDQFTSEVS